MSYKNTPYFLWDYNLTEGDIKKILNGKNEAEKIWMAGRILTSAHFNDVWKYLKPEDIVALFPKLKMRTDIKESWHKALSAWGYDV